MSRHDPQVRLRHMQDFARQALEMASGRSRGDLEADSMLRLALTHLVELVGEAAAQVPEEYRDGHADIPWPKIIGMRNRLIHGYDYVDLNILWDAITLNLPDLLQALTRVLGGPEEL